MNTTADLVECIVNKEREIDNLKKQITDLQNKIQSTITLINRMNMDSISGEFDDNHLMAIIENLKTGKNSY